MGALKPVTSDTPCIRDRSPERLAADSTLHLQHLLRCLQFHSGWHGLKAMHLLAASYEIVPTLWTMSIATAIASMVAALIFYRLQLGRTAALVSIVMAAIVLISHAGPVLLGKAEVNFWLLIIHLAPAALACLAYGLSTRLLWQTVVPWTKI